jgi:hypothetical protein
MTKKWFIAGLLTLAVGTSYGEPMRTVLTKENKFPRPLQAELGSEFTYVEYDDGDIISARPYIRYGLFENLAIVGALPYHSINPDFGDDVNGIGDATVGLEFLAYEDLFGYPWIMPHIEVSFPTGDEDKGLGAGDSEFQVGVAIGTTVHDVLHWALDVRYRVLDDAENVPSAALSIVWDLDKRFSLIAEIEVADDDENDDTPVTFLAGMHYKATRDLQFGIYGGASDGTDADTIIHGKISYSF